jgi:hypothetical protein
LTDIFGKEHVPKIGRRHLSKKSELDLQTLLLENPLKDIKDAFVQNIIPINYSVLRAYTNGYYWIKHELYTLDTRNLGYYSDLQNEMINLYRSIIIDWLNVPDNVEYLINIDSNTKKIISNPICGMNQDDNKRLIVNTYIVKLMQNNIEPNFGIFELFILYQIHQIPIIVMFNGNYQYVIKDSIKNIENTIDESKKYSKSSYICINMDVASSGSMNPEDKPTAIQLFIQTCLYAPALKLKVFGDLKSCPR